MAEEVEIVLKGRFENGKLLVDTTEKLDSNIKQAGKSAETTNKSVSKLEKTLKNIAKITGVALLVKGFGNLTKSSLKAAGAMEQVDIALTTMLGSAEDAAKLQKDLIEFAKKTPFEIEGIFDTTKKLLAYGVAQEEIIDTMSTLGNIASGLGVPMDRLALVYGQVRTAGKLMGQDLNQFVQAGVDIIPKIAEVMGIQTEEVRKFGEQGKISFDIVHEAIKNLEKSDFGGLMEKQSKTFLGTLSNMADGFYQVRISLGNALLPVAKKVVNFMIPAFDKLAKIIDQNKDNITTFTTTLVKGLSVVGKAFKFAFSIVANFTKGIITLLKIPLVKYIAATTAALILFTKAQALAIALTKVFLTTSLGWISVIGAVITSIGYLSSNVEKLPSSFQLAILEISKALKFLQLQVIEAVDSILNKLSSLSVIPGFEKFKDYISSTKDSVVSDLRDIEMAMESVASGDFSKTTQGEVKGDDTSKLSALQAENEQLLAEHSNFLNGKLELDQQYMNDEIGLDQYKAQLDMLQGQQELEALQQQYSSKLALLQENEALINQTKLEIQGAQDQAELEQLQLKLDSQLEKQTMLNEQLVELKLKKDEKDIKQQKKKGAWEIKYEKLVASEKFKGAKQAANALIGLQNSKNKAVAAMGKAAAIFQITNDTASGAMAAYRGMVSVIPGPPGIIAGATAAAGMIAYGAERIGEVKGNSFAVGTPNIPNDQVATVHKGEMIVPATFSEAIRSGQLTLSGGSNVSNSSSSSTNNSVNINFEGANFIGEFTDDDVTMMAERMGQLISEDVIPSLPTNSV